MKLYRLPSPGMNSSPQLGLWLVRLKYKILSSSLSCLSSISIPQRCHNAVLLFFSSAKTSSLY